MPLLFPLLFWGVLLLYLLIHLFTIYFVVCKMVFPNSLLRLDSLVRLRSVDYHYIALRTFIGLVIETDNFATTFILLFISRHHWNDGCSIGKFKGAFMKVALIAWSKLTVMHFPSVDGCSIAARTICHRQHIGWLLLLREVVS